jgi:hypothetical protein
MVRKLRMGLLTAVALAAGAALAAEPAIPEHTLKNLRRSVLGAESMALVTVHAQSGEGQAARVRFRVEQELLGPLPVELEMPASRFHQGDLRRGVQLLMPLRLARQDGRWSWVSTGNYELVANGQIRDVPLERYLAAAAQEAARVETERALKSERRHRAARSALSAPSTGPSASAQQPTLASGI